MKTILFDLDGTLIDSTDAILESFAVALKTFGQNPPSDEQIKSLIGHPLEVMFRGLGVLDNIQEYVLAYKKHYMQISARKTTLLPNVALALSEAASIARLGIVTTKTADSSKRLLQGLGVMHYFEVLIGRDSVEHPKPHPQPILKAMEHLQAQSASTWMIGDTILDLQSANSAGISCVALLCGYGKKQDLQLHTNYVFKDALQAVSFISKN